MATSEEDVFKDFTEAYDVGTVELYIHRLVTIFGGDMVHIGLKDNSI